MQDFCWRLLIGLGAVPGGIALYFRLTLPETPRFTMDVERNVKQASADVDAFLTTGGYVHDYEQENVRVAAPIATRRDFFNHFGKWENGKVLLGTAYSWFALDVSTFPLDRYSNLVAHHRPSQLQVAFYGLGLNSTIILQAIGFGAPVTKGTTLAFQRWSNLHNLSVGNVSLPFLQRFRLSLTLSARSFSP